MILRGKISMFDPGTWNGQEATFYVSTGLLILAFVILGCGAALMENAGNRHSPGGQLAMMFGGGLFSIAGLGYIKWILMFFFN
jgi:hypothetical protein